ncbi:lytic transglycosylase domain-containing protein [Burkholderia pyrrocinia]|jgi:soluble lytic murein transglycosylase-like protein
MAARILRQQWRRGASLRVVVASVLLQVVPAHADCLDDAAAYHRVNPLLLRSIAAVESGFNPSAVNVNSNGSTDLGLMQINTWWLAKLAPYGITRTDLLDACKSAYIGAWILSQNISKLGLTWTAVGAYNAVTPAKRLRYARRVYDKLNQLSQDTASPGRVPPVTNQPRARIQAASPRACSTRAAFSYPECNQQSEVTQ